MAKVFLEQPRSPKCLYQRSLRLGVLNETMVKPWTSYHVFSSDPSACGGATINIFLLHGILGFGEHIAKGELHY